MASLAQPLNYSTITSQLLYSMILDANHISKGCEAVGCFTLSYLADYKHFLCLFFLHIMVEALVPQCSRGQ